jgi:putative FmdB family regulatory protein
VPTYSYRCPVCGPFDLVRSMAEVTAAEPCPDCGRDGGRIWGAPALRGMDSGLRRALDDGERSADRPDVVSAVPGRSRRATPVTRDPRHAMLPRP